MLNSVISILILLAASVLFACGSSSSNPASIEPITDPAAQDTLFRQLLSLTNRTIPEDELDDSLAFLILPMEASCPACRNKAIDSIVQHKDNLMERHYIILSASGGRKTINSFFIDEGKELPEIKDKLFLDSLLIAYKYDLFKDNPVIYYTANKKAYKKVVAIPRTVRTDLQEFFSGNRGDIKKI